MTKNPESTEPRQKRKYTRRTPVVKRRKYRKRVQFSAPVQPQLIPIRLSGMTLGIWQKSPERTEWAAKMIKDDPNFQDAIAVLTNISVHVQTTELDGVRAAYLLGYQKGLKAAVEILFALANYDTPKVEAPEADYLPEGPAGEHVE